MTTPGSFRDDLAAAINHAKNGALDYRQAAGPTKPTQAGDVDERWILPLAQKAGDAVADDLIRQVARAHDVSLILSLLSVWKDRPGLERLKSRGLDAACAAEQWDNYRCLASVMESESLRMAAQSVLPCLVQMPHAPNDVVDQALGWAPKGKEDTLLERAFFVATSYGCETFIPRLLETGYPLSKEKLVEAAVTAVANGHEKVLAVLVPRLTGTDLRNEFLRRAQHSDNGVVTEEIDRVGRHLNADDVESWVAGFADRDLPISQARLRQIKSMDPGGKGFLQEQPQRPRSRP